LGAGSDVIVMSNMSPVQAPLRAAALRRVMGRAKTPVVDLFSRRDAVMQGRGEIATTLRPK
jgi:hypothetical protein